MTYEKMKAWIKDYCEEIGSCELCVLNMPEAPDHINCYEWASNDEIVANYSWIRVHTNIVECENYDI